MLLPLDVRAMLSACSSRAQQLLTTSACAWGREKLSPSQTWQGAHPESVKNNSVWLVRRAIPAPSPAPAADCPSSPTTQPWAGVRCGAAHTVPKSSLSCKCSYSLSVGLPFAKHTPKTQKSVFKTGGGRYLHASNNKPNILEQSMLWGFTSLSHPGSCCVMWAGWTHSQKLWWWVGNKPRITRAERESR